MKTFVVQESRDGIWFDIRKPFPYYAQAFIALRHFKTSYSDRHFRIMQRTDNDRHTDREVENA